MTAPRRLHELTVDPVDEAQLQRNWRAIQHRRARRRGPAQSWPRVGAAAAALAAAAGILWWLGMPAAAPSGLRLADGRAFASLEGTEFPEGLVSLDDGSRITVSPHSRMELLESSGQRVLLRLMEGRARFEVTPGGPRRWVIEAGAQVEVVGTVFTVERDVTRASVSVARGVVLVRAPGLPDGVRRVVAGQSVSVSLGRAPGSAGEHDVSTASLAADNVPTADNVAHNRVDNGSAPVAGGPQAVPAGDMTGRSEASEVSADSNVPAEEPVSAVLSPEETPLGPAELMARADAARMRGNHREAARSLSGILETYPRDSRAPIAAVTLGRLELRQLHRPARAARALRRALVLGLPPSLEEDVRAMLVEALHESGDLAAAGRAAEAYRAQYPRGRWAGEVERWSR